MSEFNLQKLTAVPSTPTTPNTFFFVSGASTPDYVELYVSSKDGTQLKRLINENDIKALIATSLAGANKYTVVDDINKRDELSGGMVFVKNATGDSSVSAGGAFYLHDGATWVKVAEAESMDMALSWDGLLGKPTSSPSQIDNAVGKAHDHSNQTQLDKIGQDGDGNLTYDGKAVGGVKLVANW